VLTTYHLLILAHLIRSPETTHHGVSDIWSFFFFFPFTPSGSISLREVSYLAGCPFLPSPLQNISMHVTADPQTHCPPPHRFSPL